MWRRCIALVLLLAASCGSKEASPRDGPSADGLVWRRLAPAPTRRTEVAAAVSATRIFVAGGFAEDRASTTAVEVFDTQTGTWSAGPPLPVALNHAMGAAVDGTVYVLGGYPGSLTDPSNRAFALRDGRWVELAPMPEPRAAAGAAVAGGRIYVAGGIGPGGLATGMLVYDPQSGTWSIAPPPPTRREHLGVAAHDGRIFVVGGRAPGNLGAAEVFDPASVTWSTLPDMPTPRGGLAAAATANGFVVAPGGEAADTFDAAEAFDAVAGRWWSLPPMPTARHGLGVVAIGCTVYTLAGGPRPGFAFSDAAEAIDLTPLRACPWRRPAGREPEKPARPRAQARSARNWSGAR